MENLGAMADSRYTGFREKTTVTYWIFIVFTFVFNNSNAVVSKPIADWLKKP